MNAQRSELENKVAILSTEIQRLLGIINDRNKTIETHKTTTTQLELRITELRSLESRTQEYEYKLNLLTGELERLSNAYRSKCEELDQAGLRISRLELENSQIGVFESDNKRLREIIDQLQRDNNDLREKIFKLEQVISELRKFELL